LKNENAKASFNVGNFTKMPFFSFARKEPDIKKKSFLSLIEAERKKERKNVRKKQRERERKRERERMRVNDACV